MITRSTFSVNMAQVSFQAMLSNFFFLIANSPQENVNLEKSYLEVGYTPDL